MLGSTSGDANKGAEERFGPLKIALGAIHVAYANEEVWPQSYNLFDTPFDKRIFRELSPSGTRLKTSSHASLD